MKLFTRLMASILQFLPGRYFRSWVLVLDFRLDEDGGWASWWFDGIIRGLNMGVSERGGVAAFLDKFEEVNGFRPSNSDQMVDVFIDESELLARFTSDERNELRPVFRKRMGLWWNFHVDGWGT